MTELETILHRACSDSHVLGIDFGATLEPAEVPILENAITQGVKRLGMYVGDVEVAVELADVWRYYVGDELIEDETGCAHVTVTYGGQTARTVLQWAHVNGSVPVDTDGDGI